jgi:CRP/FNR family transcriptional regulator
VNLDELLDLLELSSTGRERLSRGLKQYTFEHAGPVIHKGQPVAGAYLVLEGQLRVFTYSSEGSEATLYLLRPGETCVLTLNCLFNNFRYPAWVEASAKSRVALIPGELYRQLFAQEASIQEITVKALSTLVFRLMDTLEEAQTCNLEQRLARFLLNSASMAGEVRMTQQEIANHLGTTREVVARIMRNLKAEGMLSTRRGVVHVDNEQLLAALVTPIDAEWPG